MSARHKTDGIGMAKRAGAAETKRPLLPGGLSFVTASEVKDRL
jgi:hypothetical protein